MYIVMYVLVHVHYMYSMCQKKITRVLRIMHFVVKFANDTIVSHHYKYGASSHFDHYS